MQPACTGWFGRWRWPPWRARRDASRKFLEPARRSPGAARGLVSVSAAPNPPIVTVAAEHGAGGDLVAARVAEALGVPFLDRMLPAALVAAADEAERRSGFVGRVARVSTMLAE